ncbi:hypothetical protein, partial [Neptuniibacter sp.]|uniref:hypothetical protein n=1 Tax=Neptuniibacter sp. TaxID=1962643 RepID=UPI002623E175
ITKEPPVRNGSLRNMEYYTEQIASDLIEENGSLEAAEFDALVRTIDANKADDLFAVSIWRSVKQIIKAKKMEITGG